MYRTGSLLCARSSHAKNGDNAGQWKRCGGANLFHARLRCSIVFWYVGRFSRKCWLGFCRHWVGVYWHQFKKQRRYLGSTKRSNTSWQRRRAQVQSIGGQRLLHVGCGAEKRKREMGLEWESNIGWYYRSTSIVRFLCATDQGRCERCGRVRICSTGRRDVYKSGAVW